MGIDFVLKDIQGDGADARKDLAGKNNVEGAALGAKSADDAADKDKERAEKGGEVDAVVVDDEAGDDGEDGVDEGGSCGYNAVAGVVNGNSVLVSIVLDIGLEWRQSSLTVRGTKSDEEGAEEDGELETPRWPERRRRRRSSSSSSSSNSSSGRGIRFFGNHSSSQWRGNLW